MLIKRTSVLTGVERTMEIPCTNEQFATWESGVVARHAFPNLTPEQREFIMTGIVPEEWDAVFQDEPDEEPMSEGSLRSF